MQNNLQLIKNVTKSVICRTPKQIFISTNFIIRVVFNIYPSVICSIRAF